MFPSLFTCSKTWSWKEWWNYCFFPQYSIQDRRKLHKCVFGLSVWHLECMWEWSLGGLWKGVRVQGSLLKLQARFETEVLEPLTIPRVEDKDPSFRNWERSQIQRFCGRNWPMGTVSGATGLANIFLKFRCWEICPWIIYLRSRQRCQACIFPSC